MTAPMPKDNEVDEKVMPVAWIVTNGGESCEPWLEYEQSEVDALPAVCIAEPLYSAATVAELRAKADAAERRVGELEADARTVVREVPDGMVLVPCDECYSIDGDSWCDSPADAGFVDGLRVGDTYDLLVSHWSITRTYVVTKAPDETSDDYEVDPVSAASDHQQNAAQGGEST